MFLVGQLIEYQLEFGGPWELGTYEREYYSLVDIRKRERSVSSFVFFFDFFDFYI